MTHTLAPANARAYHNCSIRRASGFVQTPLSKLSRQKIPPQDTLVVPGQSR